ncbi:MAG: hypothetical protein ACTSXO_07120 [Candidatus Heimdallarchaeota archaeon]
MSQKNEEEAEIVKFPGIASISLSITPIANLDDFNQLEAVVRVYDENNEQIMRQKARSLFTIAKNLKLFIQNRTNLPINDRRLSVWFAEYLAKVGIKIDEETAYQLIKQASQALVKISRVTIEEVEASDLVSIESDVVANLIALKSDHLLSEEELYGLLEEHQSPLCTKVTRSIQYTNSGGAIHKDKLALEILPAEQVLKHALVASFMNESQSDLTNVLITDIIPFCYKLVDAKITGTENIPYKKELLENGLKISWTISTVPAGTEIKILYSFEKRIPRTIMIRKGEEIRIVQDYNSILEEEDAEGKVVQYSVSEVINLLPVTLDELIIRDLIPNEFKVVESSLPEDVELIDFGQDYGYNLQQVFTNVETGTKILRRYFVEPAPLLWKVNLEVPVEDETILATKILEATPQENLYICTIEVSTPVPCLLLNEIESGLSASEFYPSERKPENTSKMQWSLSGDFSISFVMSGTLARQPNPITIQVNDKKYTAEIAPKLAARNSRLIALPFSHVALYRKTIRKD